MKRQSICADTARAAKQMQRAGMILAAAAAAACMHPASAATSTWTGGGANGNWNNASNWSALPAPGDVLVFDGATNLATNNDFTADTLFNGIDFAATASSFTLAGNAVKLGGTSAINQASANNQTVSLGLVLEGSTTNVGVTGAGTLTLGQVAYGVTPAVGVASTATSTLNINNSVSTGSFLVRTNNTVANNLSIASGQTLTVNGEMSLGLPAAYSNPVGGVQTHLAATGGGSLVVNSGTNLFRVGLLRTNNGTTGTDPFSTLNLSALSNFTFSSTGGGHFRVGNGNSRGEMNLANNGLATSTNTITATQVRIGDTGQDSGGTAGSDNNNGGDGILRLGGGTNVFNTDLFIVGRTKGRGLVTWQGGTGSFTLNGAAGGATRANMIIGSTDNGSGAGGISDLLLAGHTANVLAGDVVIGQMAGSGTGNSGRGTVTFDTGTFDAQNIRLGVHSSTGTSVNSAVGTLTVGGGTLNVSNQFFLAQRTTTAELADGVGNGTFNVNGGTANINTDIIDASTTNAVTGPPEALVTVPNVTTLNVAGGTLNMMGKNIGSFAKPITTVNLNSGSLTNAGRISGRTITVGGATVSGAATYVLPASGALTATGGALTLASGQGIEGGGSTAATAGTITGDVTANSGSHISPGVTGVAGTLAFAGDLTLSGTSHLFKLGPTPGGVDSGNDIITVGDALNIAGGITIDIGSLGTGPTAGNYTVFTYGPGGLTGNHTNIVVNSPGTRQTFTPVDTTTTAGTVQINVAGGAPLVLNWSGLNGSSWHYGEPKNWADPVNFVDEQFFNGDMVNFFDSGTNRNITLATTVLPGSVNFNHGVDYSISGAGAIGGGTGIAKAGTGTATISTNNTFLGGVNVTAGKLVIAGSNTTSTPTNVGGGSILEFASGGSLGTSAITSEGTVSFNVAGSDLTVNNAISGGGIVVKSGTGTLTLGNNNNYSYLTNINAGRVLVTGYNSLGQHALSSAVTIADGGQLDLSNITNAAVGFAGNKRFNIVGNGPDPDGAGPLVGSGAIVNNGIGQNNAFHNIVLTGNASIGGTNSSTTNTGRFDLRTSTTPADSNPTLDLAAHTLTKKGTNQFSVVGGSINPGKIDVQQGILALEVHVSVPAEAESAITMRDGTTLQFFNVAVDPATTQSRINRLIKTQGNVTTGTSSGGTQSSTIGSNWELGGGNLTFGIVNNNAGALILNGNITETAPTSVTKTGVTPANAAATVTLNGNLGWTGNTTVNNGELVLDGTSNLLTNGAIAVNAPAGQPAGKLTMTTNGSRTLKGTSITVASGGLLAMNDNDFIVDYGVSDPSPEFTLRDYVKAVYLGGTSGISFTVGAGDVAIAVAERTEWGFSEFNGIALDTTTIVGKYTYFGDANLDGKVTSDDYVAVDVGLGTGDSWVQGDFNFSGTVTSDDYVAIDVNLGKGSPTPLAFAELKAEMIALHTEMFGDEYVQRLALAEAEGAGALVPEPGTLSLVGFGAIGLLGRRRRRSA